MPVLCRSFAAHKPGVEECLRVQVEEREGYMESDGAAALLLVLGPLTEWHSVLPMILGLI